MVKFTRIVTVLAALGAMAPVVASAADFGGNQSNPGISQYQGSQGVFAHHGRTAHQLQMQAIQNQN